MSSYDKYDPKNGGYRSPLAVDFDRDNLRRILGVGHDASGRTVIGAGQSGITGVLVLTKARKAGEIIDVMTSGEIVEFGPTEGEPGVDFGRPGTVYYSDAAGNIGAGSDEVQTITATSGAAPITVAWNGAGPTAASAGNASTLTAAQVKAMLVSLANVEDDDVSVAGPVGGPWPVTFGGQYEGKDVPAISGTNITSATGTAGGATTGLVRVGHTVKAQRLIVRVEH